MDDELSPGRLRLTQRTIKRAFDVVAAAGGLVVLGWLIPVLAYLARRASGGSGMFRQVRVGRNGQPFEIIKLRSMRVGSDDGNTITVADDPRITGIGAFLRRTKLDELPQLINVLKGEMSFVGPRPDVPAYVPLEGTQARTILSVRPGITGPATMVYRDEEQLLSAQADPEAYNRDVLLVTKARINEHYVRTWRFSRDIRYILMTMRGHGLREEEAMQ